MSQLQSQTSESAHNAAERKKSNLAFAFFCMEKSRARDMEVFYAFCRLMDDIADEETRPAETRRLELLQWKEEVAKIYRGEKKLTPLAAEMADVIARRGVPEQYIQDIIDGVLTDTAEPAFETFEDIRKYCYGVASAVGLASIFIFGFKNERTKLFAESLGYALQFTNILRDVVDDMVSHNRVYIPAEELRAFGVEREDLREPAKHPNCKRLFKFMYFRAKHFFNKARRLLAEDDRRALAPALIMWAIYEEILEDLKKRDFDIPKKPLKISKARKIFLALRAVRESKKTRAQNNFCGRATVAGAGIAGMAIATRLLYEGFDVEVFEARASAGGKISKISAFGEELDNAQHAAMGCYENFFGAIEMLGNDPRDFFTRVRGMDFIYPDGSMAAVKYPAKNSAASNLRALLGYSRLKGFASARNLLLLISIKLGAKPRENETAAEFLLRKKIPQETVESFWSPFCVSALNTAIERADARLMVSAFRKSILGGFESSMLHLPSRPIENAFEIFGAYLRGCGGRIYLGDAVQKIELENGRAIAVHTAKSGRREVENFFPAIGARALESLLPQGSAAALKAAKISRSGIANIYFTAKEKLIGGEYACLVGSRLHWIFDHTPKLKNPRGRRLYSATISDCGAPLSKPEAEKLLAEEIEKFFGKAQIEGVLPAFFADATIAADSETEKSRPDWRAINAEFPNVYAAGDWLQCGLPCTMESAAKSAFDIDLAQKK